MAPTNYGTAEIGTIEAPETEAKTIARIAQQAANAEEIYPGKLYLIADGQGGVQRIDTDEYDTRPRRKESVVTVSDQASFEAYLGKHGIEDETEITASVKHARFVARIDAGTTDEAGWAMHACTLQLTESPEWKAWTQQSGKLMHQADFAEFIENNAANVIEPSSAEILEIAQSLQVKRGVDFESGTRLQDGNVQFGYRETTTASAGAAGQLAIPATLQLALRPFEGGEAYKVVAHFRYRLNGSQLTLGYKLQDPDKIREDAFSAIAGGVRELAENSAYLYLTNQ